MPDVVPALAGIGGTVLKILIVSRRAPPYNGGAENQMARIGRALADRGHEVTLVCGNHRPGELEPVESHGSFRIVRLADPQVRFVGTAMFLLRLATWMLLNRDAFDSIIASQINETTWVGVHVGRLLGKKTALRTSSFGVNGGNIDWARRRRLGPFYIAAAARADHFVAQTPEFLDEARELGFPDDRTTVIANVVPAQLFDIQRNDDGITGILWASRMRDHKNPRMALDVAGRIGPVCRWRLSMLGKGPQLEEIRQAAGPDIRVPGMIDDMEPELRSHSIYIHTANRDYQPNSLLEAMAAGLAVVTTDAGWIPNILRDGIDGTVVSTGDVEAMAVALRRLLENPDRLAESRSAARQRARDCHHPEVISVQWERILA